MKNAACEKSVSLFASLLGEVERVVREATVFLYCFLKVDSCRLPLIYF